MAISHLNFLQFLLSASVCPHMILMLLLTLLRLKNHIVFPICIGSLLHLKKWSFLIKKVCKHLDSIYFEVFCIYSCLESQNIFLLQTSRGYVFFAVFLSSFTLCLSWQARQAWLQVFHPQHCLSNENVEQCISKRAEENPDFSDQALVSTYSALMVGVSPSILHHYQNSGFGPVPRVISFRQMRWRVSRSEQLLLALSIARGRVNKE